MAEKKNIKHDLVEESNQITSLLLNQELLPFLVQRKEIVDLVNAMFIEAHGDQEGPVHLLPEVELPKKEPVMHQKLDGQKPGRRYTFRA